MRLHVATAMRCHLQVLLAVGSTVMTVDVDSAEQTATGVGNIQKLSIAPNGQFVAAYTADGRLKVWVADFTKALSEFATQSDKLPEQLEWCGTDSVVLCWQVWYACAQCYSICRLMSSSSNIKCCLT